MDNNNMNGKSPKNNKQKAFRFNLYWMYGLIFLMLGALYFTNDNSSSTEIGWTHFQQLARGNVFAKMTVYNKKNTLEATVKAGNLGRVFKGDTTRLGNNPKAFVKIPSADKFSDFYDKAVEEHHIDTQ